MVVLLVSLLTYTLSLIGMESNALKPLKSVDELVAHVYEVDDLDGNVAIEESILTEALAPLVFGEKTNTNINDRFKEKLADIKAKNSVLYDDITFYTLYNVAKKTSPETILSTTYPSPRSIDIQRVKERHAPALTSARTELKEIMHDIYKEELDRKEKNKKIALYAGIGSTLITGATSIVITYFTVKSNC
jgi:hypothetical protein